MVVAIPVSVHVPVRLERMAMVSSMSMAHRVTPATRTPSGPFSSTSAFTVIRRGRVRIDIPSVCFAKIDIRPFTVIARILCAWVWPTPVSVSILVSHPMAMPVAVAVVMWVRPKRRNVVYSRPDPRV